MLSIKNKQSLIDYKILEIKTSIKPFVDNGKDRLTDEDIQEIRNLLSEKEMLAEDLVQKALRELSEISTEKKEFTKFITK